MNGHIPELLPEDIPEADYGGCCIGAAEYGKRRCTCWERVYDVEQKPWCGDATRLPVRRATMCVDCAYRDDSPEANGDPNQEHSDPGDLDEVALGAEFVCHQGMRRVVKLVHPSGLEYVPKGMWYDPPHRPGPRDSRLAAIPLKADGTPADLCRGVQCRREALDREESEVSA